MKKSVVFFFFFLFYFSFGQFVGRGQSCSESAVLCCLSYRASLKCLQYQHIMKSRQKSDQLPDPRFAVRLILSCLVYLTLSLWLPWYWGWPYNSRCLNFVLLVESCFREQTCLKTPWAAAQRHSEMSEESTEIYFYFGAEFPLPSPPVWMGLTALHGVLPCSEPRFTRLHIRARRGHQQRWAVCPPWGSSVWTCGVGLGVFKVRKKKPRGKKKKK